MNTLKDASSGSTLDKLCRNLLAQQQCMLVDDLAGLAELVCEQEQLWTECEAYLGSGTCDEDTPAKLAELKALVETNQLLAQQSLAFARKVLDVLADDDGYSATGQKRVRPGKSINIHA